MEVKALQQILTQFRQMQESLQKQVDSVNVEASAGGGMVTVKMNGQKHVTSLMIEPDVFAGRDVEMLQDLIQAAVNEAARRVDEELAKQMKNLTGGLPGIAGLKIPEQAILECACGRIDFGHTVCRYRLAQFLLVA
jgi:DNA-binding YbaB/EbfC family protein